jgi:hypothetical protein
MARYSVVVFKEDSRGKTDEPFLASRDPEVVRAVRDIIANRLDGKSVRPKVAPIREPDGAS